jgi:hypothetical protein
VEQESDHGDDEESHEMGPNRLLHDRLPKKKWHFHFAGSISGTRITEDSLRSTGRYLLKSGHNPRRFS